MKRIPLTSPGPPKLSEACDALRVIEESGLFSNFGPVNTRFERELLQACFGGIGECTTVCNATTGLLLAIREAITRGPGGRRRYALMPAFTFAAAAQAALWNRLTPLFCDIHPLQWTADPDVERRLLEEHGAEIAVIVPYAAFGYDIDLARYEALEEEFGIPVVIDAAASLGTVSDDGRGFGTGFSGTVVYSMHATKSFSTGEGGVLYSGNAKRTQTLRAMSNFGFAEPRNATMMGLNGKMSEVAALLACLRLESFEGIMLRRSDLAALYRELLPGLQFQPIKGKRQAHQFISALLPAHLGSFRSLIQTQLRLTGVDSATYFSPHVAEQGHFLAHADMTSLLVTQDVASRILTLPLFDSMTNTQVRMVCSAVKAAIRLVSSGRKLDHGATPQAGSAKTVLSEDRNIPPGLRSR